MLAQLLLCCNLCAELPIVGPMQISSLFLLQMVSYKIVRADNGDAWVEVSITVRWFSLKHFSKHHVVMFYARLICFLSRLEGSDIHPVRSAASY